MWPLQRTYHHAYAMQCGVLLMAAGKQSTGVRAADASLTICAVGWQPVGAVMAPEAVMASAEAEPALPVAAALIGTQHLGGLVAELPCRAVCHAVAPAQGQLQLQLAVAAGWMDGWIDAFTTLGCVRCERYASPSPRAQCKAH